MHLILNCVKMRTELRATTRELELRSSITRGGEALTMSDRVGVMNDGQLEQVVRVMKYIKLRVLRLLQLC